MRDEDLDQWLASVRQTLIGDLATVLDVEAGLRDTLLPARRAALTDDLREILDVDAGLAAIIPGAVSATDGQDVSSVAGSIDAARGSRRKSVSATATLLASLPDTERLALRGDAAIISLVLVVHLTAANIRARDLASVNDLASMNDLSSARDLAHDLTYYLDLALELDRHHNLALTHARALALALARELDRTRDIDLARTRDLTRLVTRDIDIDLARTRARTRDLALDCTRTLTRALDRDLDLVLDLDLDIDLARFQRALDYVRRNFTKADLREADLKGIPLTGIRWSRAATRWPEQWKEQIERHSEEVKPGSDVYEIRDGMEHVDSSTVLVDL